jgi:hypothetical protein
MGGALFVWRKEKQTMTWERTMKEKLTDNATVISHAPTKLNVTSYSAIATLCHKTGEDFGEVTERAGRAFADHVHGNCPAAFTRGLRKALKAHERRYKRSLKQVAKTCPNLAKLIDQGNRWPKG